MILLSEKTVETYLWKERRGCLLQCSEFLEESIEALQHSDSGLGVQAVHQVHHDQHLNMQHGSTGINTHRAEWHR